MPVGVPQSLSFKGGATHGGGSCQVSVTLDKQPTKDSQWKVIHSIVGGCPSNSTGNLSENPDGTDASVFDFSIPEGMPNGQYSLAWTWFNKIGNREMYMNCAPIEVTGGSSSNDVFDSLPDMFVINIPREECSTVEGEDFVFPSPGDSAETPMSTALGSSTIGSGCASVTNKGAGAGKAGTPYGATNAPTKAASYPATSDAATSAPAAASSAPTAAPYGGNAPVTVTTMATVTGGSVSGDSTPAASSYAQTPAAASAPAYGGSSSSGTESGSLPESNSTSSSGSCTGGSVSCSTPGNVVCIGSSQWGMCDINNCAVPMALADGTHCSGGVVQKRSSRSSRHARRHINGHRKNL